MIPLRSQINTYLFIYSSYNDCFLHAIPFSITDNHIQEQVSQSSILSIESIHIPITALYQGQDLHTIAIVFYNCDIEIGCIDGFEVQEKIHGVDWLFLLEVCYYLEGIYL